MILPAKRLIVLAAVPALVLLILPTRTVAIVVAVYDLGLAAMVLVDVLTSARPGEIVIERRMPAHFSVGAWNTTGWMIHNDSNQAIDFAITEDVPRELERGSPRFEGRIAARSRAEAQYQVRPVRRGHYELGNIYLRYYTLLGLAVRQRKYVARDDAKVYANVANLARYELAAQRHRLNELGLAAARRAGRGSMIEGLREYVSGDELADVAWKATARHGRMMVKTFEADRSQNILVVLDCGRLMATQVDDLTRLDHAINATLLLSYVAMKQGDYMSLLAFSDRVDCYVPSVKGRSAMIRMNDALYRLEPRLSESNYDEACRFLGLRRRRRSLIVIITDVIDRQASSALLGHMARFARRHLPVCVTLRNLEVERLASAAPRGPDDCFIEAVAIDMLSRRNEALAWMRERGVDVLDVDPRALTPRLLSHYLELKRSRRF